MAYSNWVLVVLLLFFSVISDLSAEVGRNAEREEDGKGDSNQVARRALKGFKETPNGGNVTYDCSPSGPCVPCAYSEKNYEKYRCSETGYRIPLKCVNKGSGSKEVKDKKAQNGRSTLEGMHTGVKQQAELHPAEEVTLLTQRHLLDDSSGSEDGNQAYITYRSCIPAENEEKLSVFGFEGLMAGLLLVSGSAIYCRRKRANAVPGGMVRAPSNSRF